MTKGCMRGREEGWPQQNGRFRGGESVTYLPFRRGTRDRTLGTFRNQLDLINYTVNNNRTFVIQVDGRIFCSKRTTLAGARQVAV